MVKRLDLYGKLTGSDDRRVILWDCATRTSKLSYPSGHVDNIFQAKFMPFTDDRKIVTVSADAQILLTYGQAGRMSIRARRPNHIGARRPNVNSGEETESHWGGEAESHWVEEAAGRPNVDSGEEVECRFGRGGRVSIRARRPSVDSGGAECRFGRVLIRARANVDSGEVPNVDSGEVEC
ncbi:hypothetical protein A4A49_51577 [Nicotiana attenuata]|uniref:Uncharacterized protein n=1 Tax=Nicotiana attenuata TaxID=49451 RepID=A0A1J6J9F7_NICAT|nr:hypothetical protein A4A49_51577 [Nicotiana attenuata]